MRSAPRSLRVRSSSPASSAAASADTARSSGGTASSASQPRSSLAPPRALAAAGSGGMCALASATTSLAATARRLVHVLSAVPVALLARALPLRRRGPRRRQPWLGAPLRGRAPPRACCSRPASAPCRAPPRRACYAEGPEQLVGPAPSVRDRRVAQRPEGARASCSAPTRCVRVCVSARARLVMCALVGRARGDLLRPAAAERPRRPRIPGQGEGRVTCYARVNIFCSFKSGYPGSPRFCLPTSPRAVRPRASRSRRSSGQGRRALLAASASCCSSCRSAASARGSR
jgi:hypothetical protein